MSVFPTCVGVFPTYTATTLTNGRIPHMRGGVSPTALLHPIRSQYSPHAWGCFHLPRMLRFLLQVFPTCVGVFLSITLQSLISSSIPHMRGGVSIRAYAQRHVNMYSPHAWGCFLKKGARPGEVIVFPTCVGVFLLDLDIKKYS